jgi:hypothetical protein
VLEREKTVRALDRAATAIGKCIIDRSFYIPVLNGRVCLLYVGIKHSSTTWSLVAGCDVHDKNWMCFHDLTLMENEPHWNTKKHADKQNVNYNDTRVLMLYVFVLTWSQIHLFRALCGSKHMHRGHELLSCRWHRGWTWLITALNVAPGRMNWTWPAADKQFVIVMTTDAYLR